MKEKKRKKEQRLGWLCWKRRRRC